MFASRANNAYPDLLFFLEWEATLNSAGSPEFCDGEQPSTAHKEIKSALPASQPSKKKKNANEDPWLHK